MYYLSFQECSQGAKWIKALKALLCGEEATKKCDRRLIVEASHGGRQGTAARVPGVGAGYVMLAREKLWDIHAMLVVRADLAPRITDVATDTEATGFAHVLGNKVNKLAMKEN